LRYEVLSDISTQEHKGPPLVPPASPPYCPGPLRELLLRATILETPASPLASLEFE
jgi:hypothetical protein